MQLRPFLDSLLPPRLSSRNSNPFALLWRHGRQAPFAADLAALATDSSHVRREVNGLGGSWFFGVWLGDLSPVAESTMNFASWLGSLGRLPFPIVIRP